MQDYKTKVIKIIKNHLPNLIEKTITIPPKTSLGDYAIPCFPYAKHLGKSPVDIAKDLAQQIPKGDIIEKIENVGPYLNIFLNRTSFIEETLSTINKENADFGKAKSEKTIVIDYSAPNVAKNMGIHNLRSTIIGQALYNVYSHLGYNTVGINHIGDWGTQFGKLIWALTKWSSPEELKEKGIIFLNELYVRFHDEAEKNGNEYMNDEARAWFKKIEQGDKTANMWLQLFIDISMTDYQQIYNRLNITFDHTTGESFYIQFLNETIKTLEDANLTEISDGALVVKFDEKYSMPPCLLKKTDGATLYGTRDIAAILYRLKTFNPDKILYLVDIAQELHFKQVFRVMERLNPANAEKFEHVKFGRLSFPDMKMSTRKGNIVPLREVLDKAAAKALETINEKNPSLANKEDVAEMVGIGAVIFGDLSHDRIHNIVFEWDKILDFQGETAPYIQYSHARIKSILRKQSSQSFDSNLLTTESEYDLAKQIYAFNDILTQVTKHNKPSVLCKYILELCQMFNSYYVHTPILKAEDDVKNSRLFLVQQVANLIKISTSLLGIKVPEQM